MRSLASASLILALAWLLPATASAQSTADDAAVPPLASLSSPGIQIVDLTHPFDESTIYWPTADGFQLIRGPAGITERGYFYAANQFAAAEHGGTHIDAPVHFSRDGATVDQIPLQQLIGAAAVVESRRRAPKTPTTKSTLGICAAGRRPTINNWWTSSS